MPSPRLLLAFVASMLIHATLFGGGTLLASRRTHPPPGGPLTPAMIEARLHAPAAVEPLLKDTLGESESSPPAARPVPPPVPTPGPKTAAATARKTTAGAQRKLAEHLYYPAAAIAAGMEGEVRLLLTLSPTGEILDAQVARGSGHTLLDQAAVRAALAMGALPDVEKTELILPVVFRLQP